MYRTALKLIVENTEEKSWRSLQKSFLYEDISESVHFSLLSLTYSCFSQKNKTKHPTISKLFSSHQQHWLIKTRWNRIYLTSPPLDWSQQYNNLRDNSICSNYSTSRREFHLFDTDNLCLLLTDRHVGPTSRTTYLHQPLITTSHWDEHHTTPLQHQLI